MGNNIILIGAGAAGLMAARELALHGAKVTVLEARGRVGGRIFALDRDEWGYGAQGGAEFVHGAAVVSKKLIAEAGLTLTNPTEWWNVHDAPKEKTEAAWPTNPELGEKLQELETDTTVAEFLQEYFGDDAHAGLRDYVKRRVEGYDAAEITRASAFALRDEMLSDAAGSQSSIQEGYGALLEFLEYECRRLGVEIILNQTVRAVTVNFGNARVECKNGTYAAHKVIVTAPLPLLKEITFSPAIPEKLHAATLIGYGAAIKILLRFTTKWWGGAREKHFDKLFFAFSREKVPTWWTQYPETHATLTGWVAGPAASLLSRYSNQKLLEVALESLSNIFDIEIEELQNGLIASKINNWPADPLARGAYSYATPESEAAIKVLSEPVDNKLFFAGEALYLGAETGTVEAALASGLEVATKILDLL